MPVSDDGEWFEWIADVNPKLRRLLDDNKRDQEERGFPYLNSDLCSQRWADIYAAMQDTVDTLKDPVLSERFESWNNTHECRDHAMISNIRQYCRERDLERGVFLVGAAHRRSIIEKLRKEDVDDSDHMEWSWLE